MTSRLPYCTAAESRDILAHSEDMSIQLDEQLKFFHLVEQLKFFHLIFYRPYYVDMFKAVLFEHPSYISQRVTISRSEIRRFKNRYPEK